MPRVSQEQAKLNRQRVVQVASALFREHGLHGVGIVDIMAAAGLTHGGFYGQFANKDALAAEAFDSALAEERRGDLHSPVSNYLSLTHVRSPGLGCPIAALANDVAREAKGSLVRSRFTAGVCALAELFFGLLPKSTKDRRRRRSLAMLSMFVGAAILARAVDDETLAEEILAAARSSSLDRSP